MAAQANFYLIEPGAEKVKNMPNYEGIPTLKQYFPRGYEAITTDHKDLNDYHVVFFDQDDLGEQNLAAMWLCRVCECLPKYLADCSRSGSTFWCQSNWQFRHRSQEVGRGGGGGVEHPHHPVHQRAEGTVCSALS